MFRIHEDVLSKLSVLSTNHGDKATARKDTVDLQPLSGTERLWLEETVKAIIRRVRELPVVGSKPIITLADLPTL